MIQVKRVYETASKEDGARFLVERLWPRGVKKESLEIEDWLKDVAPSIGLRRWFQHDPKNGMSSVGDTFINSRNSRMLGILYSLERDVVE